MTDGKPIGKITDGKPIELETDWIAFWLELLRQQRSYEVAWGVNLTWHVEEG